MTENKNWFTDAGLGTAAMLLALFLMMNSLTCESRMIRDEIKAIRVEMEKRK